MRLGFHHPDYTATHVARHIGRTALQFLDCYAIAGRASGRTIRLTDTYAEHRAYHTALHRLRKRGLIARMERGGSGVIRLTPEGRSSLPDYLKPDRFWKRSWDKRWYVLMYDVPESHRGYRHTLRKFLKRMRMGCLQKSVWITPDDIRLVYEDMIKGAGLLDYGLLLESRTVLGQPSDVLVNRSWNMERLRTLQREYLQVISSTMARMESRPPSDVELAALAHEELGAYAVAMKEDPLLPRALHPPEYEGVKVHRLHQQFVRRVRTLA